MTVIAATEESVGKGRVTSLLLLDPPTEVPFDVVVTPSASAEMQAHAQAWQDVNQTTPTGTPQATDSAGGTSATWTISGIAADVGDAIVSVSGLFVGGGVANAVAATGGATTEYDVDNNADGRDSIAGSYETAASASESASWSSEGAASYWAVAYALKQTTGESIDQEGARFGADDGGEAAHTWLAAQDAAVTQPLSQNILLSVLLNVTGSPGAKVFKLQHRKVGATTWIDTPLE